MVKFSFLPKNKAKPANEQKKWDKMWGLWIEGQATSPYAELMTYQSEINNGGHNQYFFNTENTGNLPKEMAVLKTILPEKLRNNLQDAYNAYQKLATEKADGQAETMLGQYDDAFYKNEEDILHILKEYASKL